MAIIGKIRENSVLVVTLVGLSLVLFLVGDFLTGGSGGGQVNTNIGEIFGEPIDVMEYERRVKIAQDQEAAQRQMQGLPVDESMNDMIRDQVWEQYINELVLKRELEKFGFNVTAEELNDMVHGENIHPAIKNEPAFQNPMTGEFSKDSLFKYLGMLELNPEAKKSWKQFEQNLKEDRINSKYSAMVRQGVYVTTAEAKRDFVDNNQKYKVKYVLKKYFEIPDSMVKVTDEDIMAYYEKNKFKKQYEQPGSRTFEFVQFPVFPTAEDKKAIYDELAGMVGDFKAAENDSVFTEVNADNPFYSDRFSTNGEFPMEIDSLIQAADTGDVIGPYEQFGAYKITKVRAIKTEPEARVRHILLSKEDGEMDVLKKRLDSIRAVIKRNNNFAEMVSLFSDDPGSISTGGVYEWFPEGRMVTAFNDACFKGKVGDMPIVETEYGVHLIEILGQRESKRVIYATIDRKISPSSETENQVKEKAYAFLEKINDNSKFEEIAGQEKLTVLEKEVFNKNRIIDNDQSTKELVRWVMTSLEGDVSDIISTEGNLVIAHVTGIKEKGVPEFEDVKEIMEIPTRQAKKAEMLIKQMEGASSLQEVATRVNGEIKEAELFFASNSVPGGGGNEPAVVGTVFSLNPSQKGAMLKPIEGKVGVYVVQLEDVIPAAEASDYTTNKANLIRALRGRTFNEAFEALKKSANVQDNRTFY